MKVLLSTSRPVRFNSGKERQHSLNMRLGGLRADLDFFCRREKSFSPAGIRAPNRVARRLVKVTKYLSCNSGFLG